MEDARRAIVIVSQHTLIDDVRLSATFVRLHATTPLKRISRC